MLNLRLRHLELQTNFRCNEATMMRNLQARRALVLNGEDVCVFVSRNWKQVCFVWGEITVGAKKPGCLPSVRLRLPEKGEWSPMMLAEYAAEKGIKLVNFPSFKDWWKKQFDADQNKRRRA